MIPLYAVQCTSGRVATNTGYGISSLGVNLWLYAGKWTLQNPLDVTIFLQCVCKFLQPWITHWERKTSNYLLLARLCVPWHFLLNTVRDNPSQGKQSFYPPEPQAFSKKCTLVLRGWSICSQEQKMREPNMVFAGCNTMRHTRLITFSNTWHCQVQPRLRTEECVQHLNSTPQLHFGVRATTGMLILQEML